MKRLLPHIAFLFGLCLLVNPAISLACGTNTTAEAKARCKKAKSKKLFAKQSSHKQCCSTKNKRKGCGKDCGGKCGNGDCKCIAPGNVPAAATLVQFYIAEPFTGLNNHQSLHSLAHISSGFYSVWLPPKIS